jgi:hypothetical protein
MDSTEDFVWSFRFENHRPETMEDDPLVEMVRMFLLDFQDIGFFTKNGERVTVDGFAFNINACNVIPLIKTEERAALV